MTPFHHWFTHVEPGRWIPLSREAWALTAAIIVVGIIVGRLA